MAMNSLSDFSFLINQQLELHQKMETHLCQLEALIAVARLSEDFYDFNQETLQNYLWVINDLIMSVTSINQESLKMLLTNKLN